MVNNYGEKPPILCYCKKIILIHEINEDNHLPVLESYYKIYDNKILFIFIENYHNKKIHIVSTDAKIRNILTNGEDRNITIDQMFQIIKCSRNCFDDLKVSNCLLKIAKLCLYSSDENPSCSPKIL